MAANKDITIYDLAVKLNISPTTVSRGLKNHPAINKTTKRKIFELAEEMGYRSNNFARNLRQQNTLTIGVIVPKLNSHFTSQVLSGMENAATPAGYNLIISQSLESYNKEVVNAKTMFDSRVDGLLVSLAYDSDNIDHFEQFFKRDVPVVFFDRVVPHKNSTSVLIDNVKAGFEATEHLISQGCERIVHVTAPSNRNVYIDRLEGYKKALAAANIPFKKEYVIYGNLSQEAGVEAAEVISKMKPLPDGVFASNDSAAVGAMIALKQKGYNIPGDIGFVGFNNDAISQVVEPNLSTINYPGLKMGETAVQHLLNHLKGSANVLSTDTIILRSDLIIRGSSLKKTG